MKYTDEEKEIIDEVKKYLRELRLINIEKFSLTFEIEDIPSPQSIKYSDEAPGGFSKSKGEQITSNMLRRELLTKRLELFNKELDKFMPLVYLLNAGHRNIIRTYVCSRGYNEMIDTLEESFCISKSTYKREFPKACLELSKYLDMEHRPSLEKLNNISIPLPNYKSQLYFSDFVKEVDKSRLEVQKSLKKTQELFDSLMQKYFG